MKVYIVLFLLCIYFLFLLIRTPPPPPPPPPIVTDPLRVRLFSGDSDEDITTNNDNHISL